MFCHVVLAWLWFKFDTVLALLVEEMKGKPFSLMIDGSNDTGIEKLNPLTVRKYDDNERQVITLLLDMCTTSGRDCGTADVISQKINLVMDQYDIPWGHCIGFGVDNTSVNLGVHKSIMTHVKTKNDSCYFMGCPCHIVHNIASKGSKAFTKTSGFDVEDLCVDAFYWFDKSTKRKGVLQEFCTFCDMEYSEIVRFVSVRWLSLDAAINRILLVYPSLRSYFLSESESQERFKRLAKAFGNQMKEIYLLFFQSVLPTFKRFNLFLQHEEPSIFLVADGIQSFLKSLLGRF